MITNFSHVSLYVVLDQEESKKFYHEKLGFEIVSEAEVGEGMKWITLSPPNQDLEITLMEVKENFQFSKEAAQQMRELITKGTFGFGVLQTDNIDATYEELKSKGVEFRSEPKEQFYGKEAIMLDNSGNWFSLTQPKEN